MCTCIKDQSLLQQFMHHWTIATQPSIATAGTVQIIDKWWKTLWRPCNNWWWNCTPSNENTHHKAIIRQKLSPQNHNYPSTISTLLHIFASAGTSPFKHVSVDLSLFTRHNFLIVRVLLKTKTATRTELSNFQNTPSFQRIDSFLISATLKLPLLVL